MFLPNNGRTAALSEAGVGLIGSGKAILYNSAGLAFMEGREAYFTYVDWISGSRNYIAGVSTNVPGKGTFGLSAVTFDNNDENDSEYAISGAYAFNITRRVAAGTTAKLVHHDYFKYVQDGLFNEYPDTTQKYVHNFFVFDVGAYSVGLQNLVMALSVHNLSTGGLGKPEELELQEIIRLGVLIDVVSLTGMRPLPHTLDLVLDVNTEINFDEAVELNMGMEYTYLYQAAGYSLGVSLRGGRRSRGSWSSANPITWGGGLQFKTTGGRGVKVDYARRSFNYRIEDPRVHILSVVFNF
ncbi:MAG: hypothetical protein OXG87_05335 [Gemmatimonadetes bacterium]|nr:hypothetical protein [Gemmatimonadota bacterium]